MQAKIGIALSGGGARGVAHLGILKAIEESGIRPSIISGTSAGAIVGAFYASGYSMPDILTIIKKGHFFSFSNLSFEKQGLFSMRPFRKIYQTYFPDDSFESLRLPLIVAATDLLKCELVYFSSGDLSQSILASTCIPLVFEPVRYNDTLYVDGGILNNFPVEPLLGKCDAIIGVNVNSLQMGVENIHVTQIIDRSMHLALRHSILDKKGLCDLYLEPPDMSRFGILEFKKADEIFDYGYQYGLSMAKEFGDFLLKLKQHD